MHVKFHTGSHGGVDVRWRHDKIYVDELNSKRLLLRLEKELKKSSLLK